MQIHIGCICLASLQYVFSNESAIEIPQLMHNHIDYTGKIFRQYELSNVSSDVLPESKQSHIFFFLSYIQLEF